MSGKPTLAIVGGTGALGSRLARRWAAAGYGVIIGSRSVEKAEAAVAPIYDIADIFNDPQYQALDSITTVEDEELGPVRMQNVIARLSGTRGRIRFTGRKLGEDNERVYKDRLGLTDAELATLKEKGVI